MIAHVDEHLDLCAGLALRSLDDQDQKKLVEHLAGGCEACESRLENYGAAALMVARGAPMTRPAPALRSKVLQDATLLTGATVVLPPRSRGAAGQAWAAFAGLIALGALIAAAMLFGDVRKLRSEIVNLRGTLARQSSEMAEAMRWESAVAGPAARAVSLDPLQPGATAVRAVAFYDAETHRAVITAFGVNATPGAQFVAWAYEDATPVALGVLAPDNRGRAVLRVDRPAGAPQVRSFVISREPLAESLPPVPGWIVLRGSVEE
jgi:hypothetical protein